MKEKIDKSLLQKFSNNFKKTKNDDLLQKLQTQPILDVCLNESVKKENKFEFNLELEECKIYHQGTSKRCWMFGVLNLIKNDIAHNLHQKVTEFELSPNFLNFYDKLEKANHAYQVVIDMEDVDENFILCDYDDHPLLTGYFRDPVRENGKIILARNLIKKYGVVPEPIMPETYNSFNSDDLNNWFSRKVRYDMLKLLSLKKAHKNLYTAKEKMLKECYNLLCYVLGGEPPKTFNYSYVDENGNNINLKNISPVQFYNTYCSINLDDYVQIAQMPIFEYYKHYERRYTTNVVEGEYNNFVNIPQKEFTRAVLMQLKEGIPVVIGCDNRKYRDKESKILDTRIFDFENILGIKDINKRQLLETFDCRSRHIMCVRGVHLEDEKPLRWKIEDSYGDDARNNGYYVMNNNYFEKCVYFAFINKKFLPKKVLQALSEKPIIYGFEGGEL